MDKRSWKQEKPQRGNATYKGRKIVNKGKEKWQTEKKEQQPLIKDRGRTNNKTKKQQDSDTYI